MLDGNQIGGKLRERARFGSKLLPWVARNTPKMMVISKNRDITRLVNFRLRETDLVALDKWAKRNNWSRTFAIEKLIRENCTKSKAKARG